MTDTRQKCPECDGKGIDPWGGTCIRCGGQGRDPFREWGKEQDEDQTYDEAMAREHGPDLNRER